MSTVAALLVLGVLLICIIRPPKGLPEIVFAGPAATARSIEPGANANNTGTSAPAASAAGMQGNTGGGPSKSSEPMRRGGEQTGKGGRGAREE